MPLLRNEASSSAQWKVQLVGKLFLLTFLKSLALKITEQMKPALKPSRQLLLASAKPFFQLLVYDLKTLKPSRTGLMNQYGLDKEGPRSSFCTDSQMSYRAQLRRGGVFFIFFISERDKVLFFHFAEDISFKDGIGYVQARFRTGLGKEKRKVSFFVRSCINHGKRMELRLTDVNSIHISHSSRYLLPNYNRIQDKKKTHVEGQDLSLGKKGLSTWFLDIALMHVLFNACTSGSKIRTSPVEGIGAVAKIGHLYI